MAGEHALAIKYYIMKTHPMMAHGGDSFGDGPEGRNDDPGTAVGLGGRFCDQGCAGSAQSQCCGDDLGASSSSWPSASRRLCYDDVEHGANYGEIEAVFQGRAADTPAAGQRCATWRLGTTLTEAGT